MDDKLILTVEGLKTYFSLKRGIVKAVDGIDIHAYKGKITAIVGESGSGKTVTGMSILKLIDEPGKIVGGRIILNGREISSLTEKEMQKVRGNDIAMIFQDPASALNPAFKIRKQMWETIRIHNKAVRKCQAMESCERVLKKVGLMDVKKVMDSYPYELSGGMCQRVMIAMALLEKPVLLIADEPTTALDLTIQAVCLEELIRLKTEEHMAVILITHDLGVVAQIADDVYVMRKGKIVECGSVFQIFEAPKHAYTKELLNAII